MKSYKHVLIVLGCSPLKTGQPSPEMISRMRKAINLYNKNNYSKVIFSGKGKMRTPEAIVMRLMAINHIPDSKIIIEKNSMNTIQNAVFCWESVRGHNPKSITIVTSKHHLKRTRYIFKKIYNHLGCTLRFEGSKDTSEGLHNVLLHTKEKLALAKLKLFGIK